VANIDRSAWDPPGAALSLVGAGELGYGNTTAAKEVAPQIPGQTPSDRSTVTIKYVPVSSR
jgi:hypothetical protein